MSMMSLVDTPALPQLPVEGGGVITPHRIFCIGQNYADHAKEMGADPSKEEPLFFMKPASAAVPSGAQIPFPPATQDLHYEAELAVVLGQGGTDIDAAHAQDLVWGWMCANDLTRRDLQSQARAAGRPWDLAKGFDRSAIFGEISRQAPAPTARITCHVDGALRQDSCLDQMIWDVGAVIARLSRLFTLAPGDVILTGTPAGVGALHPGQSCTVAIDGLAPCTLSIGA